MREPYLKHPGPELASYFWRGHWSYWTRTRGSAPTPRHSIGIQRDPFQDTFQGRSADRRSAPAVRRATPKGWWRENL